MQICLNPGRETENLFGVALPKTSCRYVNGVNILHGNVSLQSEMFFDQQLSSVTR